MSQVRMHRTHFPWFPVGGALVSVLLYGVLWVYAGPSASQEVDHPPKAGASPHHSHPSSRPPVAAGKGDVKLSIPDLVLLDQDGRKVRFYSDLVQGKVVAINFIFTTCTTICPPLATTFSEVQALMGDRLGRDFSLISISVDPVTDTPERLKAWGAKFQARPGWTLVTGPKPEVDRLLRALGASTARKEDHPPTILIGNDAKGVWSRVYGIMPPVQLARLIDGVAQGSAARPLVQGAGPE
ncbi:MAG: SCO family protein [Candidatus Tectomicrobia bacterium]|uniref:SCO family protein n=1 Tax=Tectimicrobiota bacterium TaxID=2528274 RepID=A0A932CLC1_UNCTE|nr:SCO family protein [Candidatus Tectomicrobia bacterium]